MSIAKIGTGYKTQSVPNHFRSEVSQFPVSFAVALSHICHVQTFIETGTYKGDTAAAVAPWFKVVYTIEGVRERYAQTSKRQFPENVKMLFGTSPSKLNLLFGKISEPCLIFLDAHWTHCGYPIEDDPLQQALHPCPLLAELDEIDMRVPHVILIDDFRFFAHPPPNRGPVEAWPSLDRIMARLPDRFVFVRNDQLCAVPERYRVEMRNWLLEN